MFFIQLHTYPYTETSLLPLHFIEVHQIVFPLALLFPFCHLLQVFFTSCCYFQNLSEKDSNVLTTSLNSSYGYI